MAPARPWALLFDARPPPHSSLLVSVLYSGTELFSQDDGLVCRGPCSVSCCVGRRRRRLHRRLWGYAGSLRFLAQVAGLRRRCKVDRFVGPVFRPRRSR